MLGTTGNSVSWCCHIGFLERGLPYTLIRREERRKHTVRKGKKEGKKQQREKKGREAKRKAGGADSMVLASSLSPPGIFP